MTPCLGGTPLSQNPLPTAPGSPGHRNSDCAHVLLQGTSGSCSINMTMAPTAPSGRATARAIPGEGSAAASRALPGTQGAPALTLSPPLSPWLQADGVCAQVLRAGPSLRGHRGAAHHGRAALAAAAPDGERLLPQRGQTLQQRPAGGAGAGLGTQSVVWAVGVSLCWTRVLLSPVRAVSQTSSHSRRM